MYYGFSWNINYFASFLNFSGKSFKSYNNDCNQHFVNRYYKIKKFWSINGTNFVSYAGPGLAHKGGPGRSSPTWKWALALKKISDIMSARANISGLYHVPMCFMGFSPWEFLLWTILTWDILLWGHFAVRTFCRTASSLWKPDTFL